MKRVLLPLQHIDDTSLSSYFYFKMTPFNNIEEIEEKINKIKPSDKIEKVVLLVKDYFIEDKYSIVDELSELVNNNSILELHIISPKKVYDIPNTDAVFFYLTRDMIERVKYFDKHNHCTVSVEEYFHLNPLSTSMIFNP